MEQAGLQLSDIRYRIIYEAFSKFSTHLSRAQTIDQLKIVMQRNLKYLFDYRQFRLVLTSKEDCQVMVFKDPSLKKGVDLLTTHAYEKEMMQRQIPMHEMLVPGHHLEYLV